jgi:hypothetical protein
MNKGIKVSEKKPFFPRFRIKQQNTAVTEQMKETTCLEPTVVRSPTGRHGTSTGVKSTFVVAVMCVYTPNTTDYVGKLRITFTKFCYDLTM